jgi:predicted CXXCH cytochrome family protein
VTTANVMPVTCPACHDPHDATNPNQLRVYGDTALLPAGFKVTGMGKGALCITCHNSRNGVQADNTLTWLHEDTNTYTGLDYSAPHLATQGDVFAGHNAWFMGIGSLPMTSKHAAVADTCVGCHMTLQPKTFLSAEGTPTTNSHLFRILDEDRATVCANCHSSSVDGEGIKGANEAGFAALAAKLTGAALTRINGITTIRVSGAVDTTPAEAMIGTNGNGTFAGSLVTAVSLAEVHGQISLAFTTSSPVTLGGVSVSAFAVQLGNVLDNTTGTPIYANNSKFVMGAWNYFLIEDDGSFGFHNPSFVQAVLNNTLAQTF